MTGACANASFFSCAHLVRALVKFHSGLAMIAKLDMNLGLTGLSVLVHDQSGLNLVSKYLQPLARQHIS